MEVDTLSLIEYVKTSIEILLNLKMETSMSVASNKHGYSNSKKHRVSTNQNVNNTDNSP